MHRVRFEYSPGRGDVRYTGNRSAFDVFLDVTGPRGHGFLGIEVKYAENMVVKAATDRDYAALAREAGVFHEADLDRLARPPLQQLWLDHLLALRLRHAHPDEWDWGAFVLLYPTGSAACAAVASDYSECLADPATFATLTLEAYLDALERHAHTGWPHELRARYLGP